MHHTSHLQERCPTSIALLFLQSCLNAHCVLAYIACWPLDRRILHELYFACAATFRVPPVFDREWFHHLANGSQLHAFSQGCAFLCFIVHAHSIGDRRTETSSYGRKKRGGGGGGYLCFVHCDWARQLNWLFFIFLFRVLLPSTGVCKGCCVPPKKGGTQHPLSVQIVVLDLVKCVLRTETVCIPL